MDTPNPGLARGTQPGSASPLPSLHTAHGPGSTPAGLNSPSPGLPRSPESTAPQLAQGPASGRSGQRDSVECSPGSGRQWQCHGGHNVSLAAQQPTNSRLPRPDAYMRAASGETPSGERQSVCAGSRVPQPLWAQGLATKTGDSTVGLTESR